MQGTTNTKNTEWLSTDIGSVNMMKATTSEMDLLDRINRDVIHVYKQCLILANQSLKADSGKSDDSRWLMRNRLKQYLKLVSENLYVFLRRGIKDDNTLADFLIFEAESSSEISKIAAHLDQSEGDNHGKDKLTDTTFYAISKILMDLHNKEKAYLYPMYQQAIRI